MEGIRFKKVCCVPFLCLQYTGIDVSCIHSKVGRLLLLESD